MLEFEKAIILSKKEHELLKTSLFTGETSRQLHHYYDMHDLLLNRKGISCCIIEKDGNYELVIKEHQKDWSDLIIENAKYVLPGYNDFELVEKGLLLQGDLIVIKSIAKTSDGIELSLDENYYLGVHDYELIIKYTLDNIKYVNECLENITRILYKCCNKHAVERLAKRCICTPSKSERFFSKNAQTTSYD